MDKNKFASISGQALVELTLVFPLMILLLFGVVEVSRVISVYHSLVHLTREGANLTSRGTDVNKSLTAVIAATKPTLRDENKKQWKVVYSLLRQSPAKPCPPKPCSYEVESQVAVGDLSEPSAVGTVKAPVKIAGMDDVEPNQIFHSIEVFYDYKPDVFSFVGKFVNPKFYERTIYTNVGAIP